MLPLTADYRMRSIATATRHIWTVVCGEFFKGLEKAISLN